MIYQQNQTVKLQTVKLQVLSKEVGLIDMKDDNN